MAVWFSVLHTGKRSKVLDLGFGHQEKVRVACHPLAVKSKQTSKSGENWDSVGQRALHPERNKRASEKQKESQREAARRTQ